MKVASKKEIIAPQKCLYSPLWFNLEIYSIAIRIMRGKTKMFPHFHLDAMLKTRMIIKSSPTIIPLPKNRLSKAASIMFNIFFIPITKI